MSLRVQCRRILLTLVGDVLTIHKADVNIDAGGIKLCFGIWNNQTNQEDTNSFITGSGTNQDPYKTNLKCSLTFVNNSDANAFDVSNATIDTDDIPIYNASKWLGLINFTINNGNWDSAYLNKTLKVKWSCNDPNGETNDGQAIELSQTFTISFVA